MLSNSNNLAHQCLDPSPLLSGCVSFNSQFIIMPRKTQFSYNNIYILGGTGVVVEVEETLFCQKWRQKITIRYLKIKMMWG